MPMVAPTFTSIDCSVYAFFVPFRLLWSKWDKFCTGGKDGSFSEKPPFLDIGMKPKYSVFDYLGFPVESTSGSSSDTSKTLGVSAFPLYAYQLIYNTYWRDENIDKEVYHCGDVYEFDDKSSAITNFDLLKARWRKDYFTSALPFQERGTPPAMYFSNAPVVFTNNFSSQTSGSSAPIIGFDTSGQSPTGSMFGYNGSGKILTFKDRDGETPFSANKLSGVADLSSVGFTTNDLRLLTQVQKFLERNARGGYRYNEWLLAHYGVAPRDETLQRPQFLGGAHFLLSFLKFFRLLQVVQIPLLVTTLVMEWAFLAIICSSFMLRNLELLWLSLRCALVVIIFLKVFLVNGCFNLVMICLYRNSLVCPNSLFMSVRFSGKLVKNLLTLPSAIKADSMSIAPASTRLLVVCAIPLSIGRLRISSVLLLV